MLYNKKGLTLIDTIISISIFSIGIAGFTMLFAHAWKTNSFIIEEGEASRGGSMALNKVITDLRKIRQAENGDYPIKSGDNFNLVVYLDDDNDDVAEKVHYFLEDGQLKKGVTEPNAGTPPTYPNGDQTVSVIANYVTNTSEQPLFYYYNEDYPGDTVNNPLNISPTLPIGDIRLVRIHLWINIKPLTAPDNVNFESFVDLRNLNENI